MNKKITYIPVMKTGDAEFRGLLNISEDVKDRITPLIELTRSRISKQSPEGDIYRRLKKLKEVYGDRQFILDLTTEEDLSNSQINSLFDTSNNYNNWLAFLEELKQDFTYLIPMVLISDINVENAQIMDERISQQVSKLDDRFNRIAYRFPINEPAYLGDIRTIQGKTQKDKLLCIADSQFILRGKVDEYFKSNKIILNTLHGENVTNSAITATSFPKSVNDYSDDESGTISLEELVLYKYIIQDFPTGVIYGDYATVHPFRYKQAGGNGWIPRIDVPLENELFFYKSRKPKFETSYAPAYIRVAKKVVHDIRYRQLKNMIGNCWGIEQIELAADGYPQGLSPSFWISVRMNINITLRDKLINQ